MKQFAPDDPNVYLTTDEVRARYGRVSVGPDGKPRFERSRMWIRRRQMLDSFPKATHFGTSPINFYRVAEIAAWEATHDAGAREVRSSS
jgi:hypothetical protein